jgi:biopolymer transport protein ExbB
MAPLKAFGLIALLCCFLGGGPLSAADGSAPAPAATSEALPDDGSGAATAPETESTTTDKAARKAALAERFKAGGKTMWFLLALSIVAVTFTIERIVNLRRGTVVPNGLSLAVRQAWRNGDHEAVLRHCAQQPSVLAAAITVMAKHRHLGAGEVSALVGDEVSRLMRQHLQKAYPMAVVATLAPLLGLLGTVVGMIDAFEIVAIIGQIGDASQLAASISMALVTTAFGLIVSIPALGSYHFFRGRANAFALEAEEEVNELLSAWFHAPAPAEPA